LVGSDTGIRVGESEGLAVECKVGKNVEVVGFDVISIAEGGKDGTIEDGVYVGVIKVVGLREGIIVGSNLVAVVGFEVS